MKRTLTYNLESFDGGTLYSASSDYRRWTTIDRHIKALSEIAGNGVLTGWEVQPVTGLFVTVGPGKGLISSLYSETKWYIDPTTKMPKKKNEAISSGDIIIEEIPWYGPENNEGWAGLFAPIGGSDFDAARAFRQLGPSGEDANNDGVVDGVLYPVYDVAPDEYLTNPYVKAVAPSSLTLKMYDNIDNFIFASRISDDPAVPFVELSVSTANTVLLDMILLARVVVRGGEIKKIDYSESRRVKGLDGAVANFGKYLLARHHHGGASPYDPPLVQLGSDIRDCSVYRMNSDGSLTFTVNSPLTTKATLGHKHTYMLDDAIGYSGGTQMTIGNVAYHYHAISENAVLPQASQSSDNLDAHTHELSTDSNPWTAGKQVAVYVDGTAISPSDYTADSSGQKITLNSKVASYQRPIFSCDIPLINGETYHFEQTASGAYSFSVAMMMDFQDKYKKKLPRVSTGMTLELTKENLKGEVRSPFDFFTLDLANYELDTGGNLRLQDPVPANQNPAGPIIALPENSIIDISGQQITAMKQQAVAANASMANEGDFFAMVPPAARWAKIVLVKPGRYPKVQIQVLGEAETTGMLRSDSIPFVRAEKFDVGQFQEEQLPPLDHVGRIGESFTPAKERATTWDSYNYSIVPFETASTDKHSHRVAVNANGDGVTTSTLVNGDVTVFVRGTPTAENPNGPLLLINHAHKVSGFSVLPVSNKSLNAWNNKLDDTGAISSEAHSHDLFVPAMGNYESVYSTYLDKDSGDTIFATSDGVRVNTANPSLHVFARGYHYYSRNTDFREVLNEVISAHWDTVGEQIEFLSEELVTQTLAGLTQTGDTASLQFKIGDVASYAQDRFEEEPYAKTPDFIYSMELFVEDHIPVPYFYYDGYRLQQDVTADDEVWGVLGFLEAYLEGVNVQQASLGEINAIYQQQYEDIGGDPIKLKVANQATGLKAKVISLYRIRKYYDRFVFDKIRKHGGRLFISGPELSLVDSDGSLQNWRFIYNADGCTVTKATDVFSGKLFFATDKGVFYETQYQLLKSKTIDVEENILAMLACNDRMLVGKANGIFLSNNGIDGWKSVLSDVTVSFLTRDFLSDKTKSDPDGHYHFVMADINGNGYTSSPVTEDGTPYAGPDHFHEVSAFVLQESSAHTHSILSVLYALTTDNKVFKSLDSGKNWQQTGIIQMSLPEVGDFVSAFGKLLVLTDKGVLYSADDGTTWTEKQLDKNVYSHSWNEEMDTLFLCGDNIVYQTHDGTSYSAAYAFNGSLKPVPYINGEARRVTFRYSNKSGRVTFYSSHVYDEVMVAVNYARWTATDGKWDPASKYDIYFNQEMALSTKDPVDRRLELCPYFTVNPTGGELIFSTAKPLQRNAIIGDSTLYFSETSGIYPGYILSTFSTIATNIYTIVGIPTGQSFVTRYLYTATVLSVNKDSVVLDEPLSFPISAGVSVSVIPHISDSSEIMGNIYEPDLTSAGFRSHDEIEDTLSMQTMFLPAGMGNLLAENLSVLTSSVKFALPTIDEYYENWKSYPMDFSINPSFPNYIGNFFDVQQSNIKSGVFQSTYHSPKISSIVNTIHDGEFNFNRLLFAGTDAGLFLSKREVNLEAPWFYINTQCSNVTGVLMSQGDKVVIGGDAGLFVSENNSLTSWKPVFEDQYRNQINFLEYRWKTLGNPGPYWWGSWNGGLNLIDSDLTNIMFAGGQNMMLISLDVGLSWTPVSFPKSMGNFTSFNAITTAPVRNGSCLALINDISTNTKFSGAVGKRFSAMLDTTGTGTYWEMADTLFPSYTGKVTGVSITDENNTKFSIALGSAKTIPNLFAGKRIQIGENQFYIISNRGDEFVLYGSLAANQLFEGLLVEIQPLILNDVEETNEKNLFLATETGLFTDDATFNDKTVLEAPIKSIFTDGVVDGVDIEGQILNVSSQSASFQQLSSGVSSVLCKLNRSVTQNELVGRDLFVTAAGSPTIYILSPQPSEVVTGQNVTVSLMAVSYDIANGGYIGLQLDGNKVEYTKSTTYTFTNVPVGSHSLRAFITDAQKTPLASPTATQTILFSTEGTGGQTISFLYPTNNEVVRSSAITAQVRITLFTTGIDGWAYYSVDNGAATRIDSTSFSAGTNTASISISNLTAGSHRLSVWLTDLSGNELNRQNSVYFTYTATTEPIIEIVQPVAGEALYSGTVQLAYKLTNFGVPSQGYVEVVLDEQILPLSESDSFYTLSGVGDGAHSLRVHLLDLNKQELPSSLATDTVNFSVDLESGTQPTINIVSPPNNSRLEPGGFISVSFSVLNFDIPSDGGVIVETTVNGVTSSTFRNTIDPITVSIGTQGTYAVKLTLAQSLTAPLTNSTASSSVNFTVGTASTRGFLDVAFQQSDMTQEDVPVINEFMGYDVLVEPNSGSETTPTSANAAADSTAQRWVIKSNTAASVNGETTIVVSGVVGQEFKNASLRVIGEHSFLYVDFSTAVDINEFEGGQLIVHPDEYNGGKKYYILGNTTSRVEVSVPIYPAGYKPLVPIDEQESSSSSSSLIVDQSAPQKSQADVGRGQKIILVNAAKTVKLTAQFGKEIGPNQLVGSMLRFMSSKQNDTPTTEDATATGESQAVTMENLFSIVENTPSGFIISPAPDPASVMAGDIVSIMSTVFSPVSSFNHRVTNIEADHYHEVELVGKLMRGSLSNFVFTAPNTVDLYVYNTEDLENMLFADNNSILNGEKIYLCDPNNPSVEYVETIVGITPHKITVSANGTGDWNVSGTEPDKISKNFNWVIDGRCYGKTSTPIYVDFVSLKKSVIRNADKDSNVIAVGTTADLVVGDTIRIVDSDNVPLDASITAIIDAEEFRIDETLPRTFFISRGAVVNVMRDTFANSHTHYVKNLEVTIQSADDYAKLGYPREHGHRVTNLIENVMRLEFKNKRHELIACGNSKDVFVSRDEGLSWSVLLNVENYADETEKGLTVSALSQNQYGDVFVGTTRGFVVAQIETDGSETPLEYPLTEEFLPSSSSESSGLSDVSTSSSQTVSGISEISISTSESSQTQSTSSTALLQLSSASSSILANSSESSSSISSQGLFVGIVGWWKMDEDEWVGRYGEVRDASGFDQHGIIYGNADTTTGAVQGRHCGHFGLPEGFAEIPKSDNFNFRRNGFTISLWTKDENDIAALLAKDDWYGAKSGVVIFTDDKHRIRYYSGDTDDVVTFGETSGEWKHIAVVCEGTPTNVVTTYRNGQLMATASEIRDLNNNVKLRFGNSLDGRHNFAGKLDDIRIYNRPLSDREVQFLYEQYAGGYDSGSSSSAYHIS